MPILDVINGKTKKNASRRTDLCQLTLLGIQTAQLEPPPGNDDNAIGLDFNIKKENPTEHVGEGATPTAAPELGTDEKLIEL